VNSFGWYTLSYCFWLWRFFAGRLIEGRGIHGDGGRLRCWMALNSWVDAASGEVSLRAVVRQLLQLLQRRRAAAVVGAWAGAADDLRRRRKLAQRSQCRILSAAWNWWANGVASSAAEAKSPTAVSSAAIEDPRLTNQVGAGSAISFLRRGMM